MQLEALPGDKTQVTQRGVTGRRRGGPGSGCTFGAGVLRHREGEVI